MICPLFVASDLSAVAVGDTQGHGGGDHVVFTPRSGAGDEDAGCDCAGGEPRVHLVAGGGDHRCDAADDTALEGAVRAVRIRRLAGPAPRGAVATAGSLGRGGADVAPVPGEVSRL